ncbi:hypothetical protein CEXT_606021 [Caerostris extrusa]|uniref:Secreted protein n=1 Tax=Caerostris extrusa TaxID=172846 RepID=A0AAV4PVN1_CAEEX|nr:hypothetical protein CEXT_606021 [Caerostris extrusa]
MLARLMWASTITFAEGEAGVSVCEQTISVLLSVGTISENVCAAELLIRNQFGGFLPNRCSRFDTPFRSVPNRKYSCLCRNGHDKSAGQKVMLCEKNLSVSNATVKYVSTKWQYLIRLIAFQCRYGINGFL